jgi:hypothetical protein
VHWKNYVSDEFYELFSVIMIDEKGWKVMSDELQHVDVLLVVEGYHEPIIQDLTALHTSGRVSNVLLFADDWHYFTHEQYDIKRRLFSLPFAYVLSTYAPQVPLFYPDASFINNVLWVPHSASRRFHSRTLNATAVPTALLMGSTSRIYKYRSIAQDMIQAGNAHILQIKHPGYDEKYSGQTTFVDSIMPYAYALTCGSAINYVVAKFFEIPATGHLMLVNGEIKPHLRRLFFVENVHYRKFSHGSLEGMVNDLNSTATRDLSIREAGKELVSQLHTTDMRAQLVMQIAASLLEGKTPRGFFFSKADVCPIFDPYFAEAYKSIRENPKK